MILRGGHCRRQVAEAEFVEAGQEALLLLAAKHPEHEFRGVRDPAPRHHGENEAGKTGVIEVGDTPPAQPLCRLCVVLRFRHFHSQFVLALFLGLAWAVRTGRVSFHTNFMAKAVNIRQFSVFYRHGRGTNMRNTMMQVKKMPVKNLLLLTCIGILALPLAACNEQDSAVTEQTFGPSPTLPAPQSSWIPTVNVAKAVGWSAGGKPIAANGMAVNAFATGLDHPRTLYVLPNGDVLVAETSAPPKPDDSRGIKGWITKMVMGRAGAGTTSADRITLLRDADGDGVAETKSAFLEGLHSPFGMALVGDDFYVADSDAIMKFPYHAGDTRITTPGVKLADLPAGRINHHWTKDLTASPDGTKLYATVGSNSNVGENGI